MVQRLMASASPNDDETDCHPEEGTGATGGPAGGRRGRAAQGQPNVTFNIQRAVFQAKDMYVQNPIIFTGYPCRMKFNPRSSDTCDEALRPTTPPEDLSSLFQPEELKGGLEEKLFVPIARSFDQESHWRWFGRKLELGVPVFNNLEENYSDDVPELVYQMLIFYRKKHPLKTIGDVVKVLCDSRNQMAVRALKKYLDEQETE